MGPVRAAMALLATATLAAACASAPLPSPSTSVSLGDPTPGADHSPLDLPEALGLLGPRLDAESRDVLAVIEPEEDIEATLDLPNARDVQAVANGAGFRTELVNDGTVIVKGPRADVIRFAAAAGPVQVRLAEDSRVGRWLPADRPAFRIPQPGAPYLANPLGVDRSALAMTPEQAAAQLRLLAQSIVTVDGRPYTRLNVDGDCSGGSRGVPVSCQLRAWGVTADSAGRRDTFTVILDGSTGAGPVLDSVIHEAVPRPLLRTAEWIARHDPAAAAAISTYATCCSGGWAPDQPGVLVVRWSRPCASGLSFPGAQLADTGSCFEGLEVTVDVGAGSVVSVTPRAGP